VLRILQTCRTNSVCALAVLSVAFTTSAAPAQDAANASMLVRIVPPEASRITDMTIPECEFVSPFIDGVSGVFSCAFTDILGVQITREPAIALTGFLSGEELVFGIVEPRGGFGGALPAFPPFEVVRYADTLEEAWSASVVDRTMIPGRSEGASGGAATSPGQVETADEAAEGPAASDVEAGPMAPGPGAPVASLIPFMRMLGEATQTDGVPESVEPRLETRFVYWRRELGELAVPEGVRLEPQTNDVDFQYAIIGFPPDRALAGEIVLSVADAEGCEAVFVPALQAGPQEIRFPCRAQEFEVPAALDISGPNCRLDAEDETLSCLMAENEEGVTLSSPVWGDIAVSFADWPADAAIPIGEAFPSDIAPRLGLLPDLLEIEAYRGCADFDFTVAFGGYCAGPDVAGCSDSGEADLAEGRFPTLEAAGWESGVPGHARLLARVNGEVRLDEVVALTGDDILGFQRRSVDAARAPILPLDLEIGGDLYGNGREVLFYPNPACEGAPSGSLDLAIRDLPVPDASLCGSLSVHRDGRRASTCEQIALAPESGRLEAVLPPDACPSDRIVVLVAQNHSLNGAASRATKDALTLLLSEFSSGPDCVPVDFVTTRGESREVVARAEDLFFGGQGVGQRAVQEMSFVNPASELLRDFGWIYRGWGPTLARLIVVADGSATFVSDITDSPEALAWEVLDVPLVLIDASDGDNCAMYSERLFFDDCINVGPSTLAFALIEQLGAAAPAD
jgi:hypothetical protein